MFLASFVEKNIFDLEISGGHFVFALKKFRPRVSKWHPADLCSGHPIVSESIIKHRPYRETRFSQNPLDYKSSVVKRDDSVVCASLPISISMSDIIVDLHNV